MPARVAAQASTADTAQFEIADVAAQIGVKPSVLQYWEQAVLAQRPNKAGSRPPRYGAADVALLEKVKHLLYTERLTVDGARRRMSALRRVDLRTAEGAGGDGRLRSLLAEIQRELQALQLLLH